MGKKIKIKKFSSKNLLSVGSIIPFACNAKLMKSNDFNPDFVDLAIWIVDKMAIINDEISFYVELAQKFVMFNPLPSGAVIRNYISKYLTKK